MLYCMYGVLVLYARMCISQACTVHVILVRICIVLHTTVYALCAFLLHISMYVYVCAPYVRVCVLCHCILMYLSVTPPEGSPVMPYTRESVKRAV